MVTLDPASLSLPLLQGLLEVGERFALTAYDAAYLALAMREGCPLATNDEPMKAAAKLAGVPLFAAAGG